MADDRTPEERRQDRVALCLGLSALGVGALAHSAVFILGGALLVYASRMPWPKETE